jgi:hypothetical protein
MTTRIVFAALGAWALAPLPALGQASAGRHFCRDGQPSPACTTFIVFEAGVGHRSRGGRGELDLSWHAGVLTNRGRSAVGATVFAATDLDLKQGSPSYRVGVLPRYRRWLSRGASLDLSAGPVLELPQGARSRLGLSAEAAVGWGNDLAIAGRVDLGGRNGVAWVGGVKLGSTQAGGAIKAEAVGLAVYGLITFVKALVRAIDIDIDWCIGLSCS